MHKRFARKLSIFIFVIGLLSIVFGVSFSTKKGIIYSGIMYTEGDGSMDNPYYINTGE